MAESIASTSLRGHRPLYTGAFIKNFSNKRRLPDNCRFPIAEVLSRRVVMASSLPRLRVDQSKNSSIKAFALKLANEAYSFKEDKLPHKWNYLTDTGVDRKLVVATREKSRKPFTTQSLALTGVDGEWLASCNIRVGMSFD